MLKNNIALIFYVQIVSMQSIKLG